MMITLTDTLAMLHSVQDELNSAQEDVRILKKIIDLGKLLKTDQTVIIF